MDFLNKIVKKSLYDQKYKQIGRLPKFFNTAEKKSLPQFELDMWPGYTCQVKCVHDGFFLNVDTSTKFLQQRTVLDLIKSYQRDKYSSSEISKMLTPKWEGSESQSTTQSDLDARRLVVITSYNSASYQIEEILWDQTPETVTFFWKQRDPQTGQVNSGKVNLVQYMELHYKIKLRPDELRQPVLKLSQRGQSVYLIPSRCHEASLPKNFTRDANKMRSIREEMITDPTHRYERIGSLVETFSKANFLEEWQVKINQAFATVKAKQLFHCKVIDPKGNTANWEAYEGKRFPHTQPLHLINGQWAVVYNARDFDFANTLVDMMRKASGIFGIKVEDPQWIEVPSGSPAEFNKAIKADINPTQCKIAVVVLQRPEDKKTIKSFLDQGAVPSQFILTNKLKNAKIGVFSNLLKQMNAKLR